MRAYTAAFHRRFEAGMTCESANPVRRSTTRDPLAGRPVSRDERILTAGGGDNPVGFIVRLGSSPHRDCSNSPTPLFAMYLHSLAAAERQGELLDRATDFGRKLTHSHPCHRPKRPGSEYIRSNLALRDSQERAHAVSPHPNRCRSAVVL
jgi:hypothetical protein